MRKKTTDCPFTFTLSILEGKWKLPIINILLQNGTMRFKELERGIDGITARMLTKELKELEEKKIVKRKAYATVPPTVEYTLTECGMTLKQIIQHMHKWGEVYNKMNSKQKNQIKKV
ncbi:MAG TPA: helix-turn-helix domain-containing protein [Chitinophagales bacterium]|nr:helix-turn-helix domain-containing protein [Chitinophagales bacterium]HNL84356.1 helix-turn-helix domain-containing protein [Chitinophagales bacterium]